MRGKSFDGREQGSSDEEEEQAVNGNDNQVGRDDGAIGGRGGGG